MTIDSIYIILKRVFFNCLCLYDSLVLFEDFINFFHFYFYSAAFHMFNIYKKFRLYGFRLYYIGIGIQRTKNILCI